MMFHASIAVHDPERAAHVIAELWGGEAFPFSPGRRGSWIVAAGDERGSIVEVDPLGHLLHLDGPAHANDPLNTSLPRESSTHLALGTVLSREQVADIGRREGWTVRDRKRSGFAVVELWLEDSVMLELLTKEMQSDYLLANTLESWRKRVQDLQKAQDSQGKR
jgi:hypothetical protein